MAYRKLSIAIAVIVAMAIPLSIPTVPTPAYAADEPVHGVYGSDDSANGTDIISSAGFNTVLASTAVYELDALHARGLQAVVWLGEYNRNRWGVEDAASRCNFLYDDQWIYDNVTPIAGHPAIAAYLIADEPSYARQYGCDIYTDLKGRSDLIKSIDPSATTFTTLPASDGIDNYPYIHVAGTVDILGLVIYPCSYEWDTWGGCQYDMIDTAIAAADEAGIERYWAIVQGFGDGWYREPTFEELEEQFRRWGTSRAEGALILDWDGIASLGVEQLRALNPNYTASATALFLDVPGSYAFYDEIEWLANQGITKGCNPPLNNRFCPDQSITRGQMAAFLARAFGYTSAPPYGFSDIAGSVFEPDINAIAAADITKGCNPPSNDMFCPGSPVTRGQMAAFLVRAFDLPPGPDDAFEDDDGSVFEDAIDRLAAAGITNGCTPDGRSFCPDIAITRAQMAAFLARMLNQ